MGNIIDTLVYDRTQDDLQRVHEITEAALTKGWAALSAKQKAEWLAGMKGAYNYTDLNRVGEAVQYLRQRFHDLPDELAAHREKLQVGDSDLFSVPYERERISVTGKTDWTVRDIPTQTQMDTYLRDIRTLRSVIALSESVDLPSRLTGMDIETANLLERCLFAVNAALLALEKELHQYIDRAFTGYVYSGECFCGE